MESYVTENSVDTIIVPYGYKLGAVGPGRILASWKVEGFSATSDRGCSQCFSKEHLWLGFIPSGPNHFCHEFWDLSFGWVCLSETDGYSNRIWSCIIRVFMFIYDVFSFTFFFFNCFWCWVSLSLPWLHTCSRKTVNSTVLSCRTHLSKLVVLILVISFSV